MTDRRLEAEPLQAEPLLTPQEVATMFRVDVKSVTRWARQGKLMSIRTLGGHRRYKEAEVRALLTGVPEQPADPLKAHWRMLWRGGKAPAAIGNRLRNAGVKTVGGLASLSADDLTDIGLRPPQIDEVRLVLHRKGFALRGEIASSAA